MLKPISCVRQQ